MKQDIASAKSAGLTFAQTFSVEVLYKAATQQQADSMESLLSHQHGSTTGDNYGTIAGNPRHHSNLPLWLNVKKRKTASAALPALKP
ncbi:hypothetical protein NADE_009160 [Nannochloris sp. 'desiccata']|nr:hypothetical protein NADE_009160 [Chlorella desiccata (nom. nud.)]